MTFEITHGGLLIVCGPLLCRENKLQKVKEEWPLINSGPVTHKKRNYPTFGLTATYHIVDD